jgi:hypothetical protein
VILEFWNNGGERGALRLRKRQKNEKDVQIVEDVKGVQVVQSVKSVKTVTIEQKKRAETIQPEADEPRPAIN